MRKSFWAIIATQLFMYAVVILNIQIAREIFVCVYLTIVPGILILKLLRLQETSFVDTILFSVALSIAFLMFVGFLANELFPFLGVSRPLSTIPLMITLSVLTSVLFLVGYEHDLVRNKNVKINTELKTIPSQVALLVFLPLLGIIGALYANIPLLLLMILVIAVLYALSVSSSRLIPTKLYPLVIIVTSTALLFHTSLISKYLIGFDVHLEYYIFKLTGIDGCWHPVSFFLQPSATTNYKGLLSITILPTIYSLLSNVKGELIFKIIYPLVFSLVPLALYRVYEGQTGKLVALLSTFFFMSSMSVFYGPEPLSIARQIIGELFFVLLMFLSVNEKMDLKKRQALFMIFGAALIVSHYSLAYIYLFYIVLTSIFSRRKGIKKLLKWESVLFFAVMTFSWYVYVSYSPTKTIVDMVKWIYQNFYVDILNPKARSPWLFSLRPTITITSLVDRVLFYVRQFFIAIGSIKLIVKTKETNFDLEYRLMSILSIFILISCIAIPHFAPLLNFERFYHVTLLFLAPFFFLGGETVLSWIEKVGMFSKIGKRSYKNLKLHLVSIVLIASFLFQVGFVNHIVGDVPYSFSLDMNRIKTSKDLRVKIGFYTVFIPEQDVFSATWLSRYRDETSLIYADLISRAHVLTSYGLISEEGVSYLLSKSTKLGHNFYIYLRRLNVIDGVIIVTSEQELNISEISPLLNQCNKIYSNEDSEIYSASGD